MRRFAPAGCQSPHTRRLLQNIDDLVDERRSIPPHAPDAAGFLAQLSPEGQKQYGFDPRAPRVVTAPLALKKGCNKYTGTSGRTEATSGQLHCRCVVDAAIVAPLPESEMRSLAAAFDDRTLKQTVDRNPAFAEFWRDCLQ